MKALIAHLRKRAGTPSNLSCANLKGAVVAWLPLLSINGSDTHFFTFGTVGQSGADAFSNVQLEAALSYYFPNGFSVGVGARYWHLRTAAGNAKMHFETVPLGFTQAAGFSMDRWGVYLQTSYQWGQLHRAAVVAKKGSLRASQLLAWRYGLSLRSDAPSGAIVDARLLRAPMRRARERRASAVPARSSWSLVTVTACADQAAVPSPAWPCGWRTPDPFG